MPIRLKFKVVSLVDAGGGIGKTVNLAPVMDAEENQHHYRAQSGHMLAIGTLHNDSAQTFETGKEYWMEFMPADEEHPEEQHDDQNGGHQEEQPEPQQAPGRAPAPRQPRAQEWLQDRSGVPASRSARETTVAHRASRVASEPAKRGRQPQSRLTQKRSKTSVRR